ncbi:MAG: ABC transporter permease, partial [Persicimonas sp.]
MSYERFIGLRYLMAKKRSRVVSVVTLISVIGVALGVTALIVVLSVMGGFKKDLEEKILGTKAHVVVQAAGNKDLTGAHELADRITEFDGVIGAEPYMEAELMVSSASNLSGLVLRGVDPDRAGQVSDLPEALDEGEGELSYLDDPKPLFEKLDEERDRDIDEILDGIGEDDDDEHVPRPEGSEPGGAMEGAAGAAGEEPDQERIEPPDFPDAESDEKTDDRADAEGDEEGDDIMPPIADEDDGEAGGGDED